MVMIRVDYSDTCTSPAANVLRDDGRADSAVYSVRMHAVRAELQFGISIRVRV